MNVRLQDKAVVAGLCGNTPFGRCAPDGRAGILRQRRRVSRIPRIQASFLAANKVVPHVQRPQDVHEAYRRR